MYVSRISVYGNVTIKTQEIKKKHLMDKDRLHFIRVN